MAMNRVMANKSWILGLDRKILRLICAAALVLLFVLPGMRHGLWRPDEARVAGICAAMANTGDFLVPYLNGEPFLEQPPLYYAWGGLFGRMLGAQSDLPFQLASMLMSLATLALVYFMMRRRGGTSAGVLAVAILASTALFFRLARWVQVDIALVATMALAMSAACHEQQRPSWRDSALLGAAMALAFMVKGMVGPAMIYAALLLDALRQRSFLRHLWLAPLVAGGLILPWIWALYMRGGWQFVDTLLITNNLQRFFNSSSLAVPDHYKGPFFYLTAVPQALFPWTLALIPAIWAAVKNYRDNPYLAWVIGPLLLLEFSAAKRHVYIAPLCPAVACLLADWWRNSSKARWEKLILRLTEYLAVLTCLAPFAIGIYMRVPVVGVVLGLLGMTALLAAYGFGYSKRIVVAALMLVGMSVSTSAIMAAQQPVSDLLPVARLYLSLAKDEPVTILGTEEATRGVFYLAAGHVLNSIDNCAEAKTAGLYVWIDAHDALRSDLAAQGQVRIIRTSQIGRKSMVLARFVPRSPDLS